MDASIIVLLFAAGFAGGLANAIAGGATLITFPAMLTAGLPPVIANASNAVAVTPGHLVAAISDRDRLPNSRMLLAPMMAAIIGGTIGAVLLIGTSERFFTLIVPALIGAATLVFAFAKTLQSVIKNVFGAPKTELSSRRSLWIGLISIYGGYFGAGLGIMLMAGLSVTGREELRAANALKNFLSTGVSLATAAIFSIQGIVSWPATLLMLVGAIIGGFAGGRLIRVLSASFVRSVVIIVGVLMTAIYAYRYWV